MAQITFADICNIQDHIMECIMDTIPQLMRTNKDVEYDFTKAPNGLGITDNILGIHLNEDDTLAFRAPIDPKQFGIYYIGYDTLTMLLAAVETCTLRKNRKLFKEMGVIKKA